MLNLLHFKFSPFRYSAGIHIILLSDNTYSINVILLKVSRNNLRIITSVGLDSFDRIGEIISKEIPISISIEGKGVLHKKITTRETEIDDAFKTLFPSADKADFFTQLNLTYISVCRRSKVNEILGLFEKKGYSIFNIHLGGFSISSILPFVPSNQIITDSATIIIENNAIIDYAFTQNNDSTNNNINLLGLNVHTRFFEAFSNAVGLLLPHLKQTPTVIFLQNQHDWNYRKLTRLIGGLALISFFIILLINFMVFNSLNLESIKISDQLDSKREKISMLDTLRKNTKEKEQFLKKSGWFENPKSAFICNRLVASLPESINLNLLNVFPLDRKVFRQDHRLLFENGIIEIKGNTSQSFYVNDWLKAIKKFNWVGKVEIVDYKVNDENLAEFYLKVYIK